MRKTSRQIFNLCMAGIGIAVYVVFSMMVKIPLVNHIALDLGYVALAVYAYILGPWYGAAIGGTGCVLVSLLTSGWFPPGWLLGNLFIGFVCGLLYAAPLKDKFDSMGVRLAVNILLTCASVFIGVGLIKTGIECAMFGIPWVIKFASNCIAVLADAISMSIGAVVVTTFRTLPEMRWRRA